MSCSYGEDHVLCEEKISIWKALALAFENNICVDGISEDCDKMLVSKMKPFPEFVSLYSFVGRN